MTKKLLMVFLTAALLTISAALFADTQTNNSAVAYVRSGLGAKELAMGSAVTASVDNVTAGYWNPAGLANMKSMEFAAMYSAEMGLDRQYNYAAFGIRFSMGAVAITWVNAGVADIQSETDEFDNNEHCIGLSYAAAPGKFKIGATAKMYISKMDDDSDSGYGFDLGAIYDVNQYLSFGFMARDIFGELADDTIPTRYSGGAAIYPFKGITLTSDVRKEKHDDNTTMHFGAEYWASLGSDAEVNSQLSGISLEESTKWEEIMSSTSGGVRVGLNDGNLTGGAGLRFRMFEIDYAYTQKEAEIFNDSHRISLIIRF